MSPVSPVFHTVATVSIGFKSASIMITPFYNIRCPCFKSRVSKILLDLIIIVCDRRSTMGIVKKPFGF